MSSRRQRKSIVVTFGARAAAVGTVCSSLVLLAAAGAVTASRDDLKTGHLLVANQQAASASLIDLATDRMTLIDVGIGPHEAAISPDGRTGVVTIYGQQPPGNELAVVDIATAAVTRRISLGEYTRPHSVTFLPGQNVRVLVTSETTQNLVIVDIAAGKVESAIATGAAGSHMAALTKDGTRAFTANVMGGSVSEVDLAARMLVRVIPVAPQTEGIAVTPDGSAVWVGSNANKTVSVIDVKTGTIAETLSGFTFPYRIAISQDGRTAIVCDPQGNKIHVADVATRKVVWTVSDLGSPRGVAFAPDGRTAFVTLATDPAVGVIDLIARKLTRKIGVGASPDGVGYGVAIAR